MFTGDTNLLISNCNIPVLFATVNSELSKINQWFLPNKLSVNSELSKINRWFLPNKLSLNVTKPKYSFFHEISKKDDIPLDDIPIKLPNFQTNNYNIERIQSI